MTKDEIQSGNELIAKFMGYKSCFSHITDKYDYTQTVDGFLITGKCNAGNHQEDEYENFAIEHLIFHSSWDWLIPVIDKIYSMNEYIEYKDYMNNIICDGGIDINTKFIQITFSDVVEFIKWYNNKINK